MIKKMITRKMYLEDRNLNIKTEGPAIFGPSIVRRLLKAKVEENGQVQIKRFDTLGPVIDLVKENKLKNVRSLFRKQRREILDYLEDIGILNYLGIDDQQKENLCNASWTSKN